MTTSVLPSDWHARLPSLSPSQQRELTDLLTGRASREFSLSYRHHPAKFVHDCFVWRDGEGPAPYQDEILTELVTHRREAVRGPHGLGKTALNSWAVLWFALTSDGDDWKAPTTASVWRQLTKYLWPEIAKWARRLDWAKVGRSPFDHKREQAQQHLRLRTGEAFAVASNEHANIEGAHASRLFYVFDEAKTIPAPTWDAVEGAFATAGADTQDIALALATSTPGSPAGRFYDIHARKAGLTDWHTRHVTLDECIAAGRVSTEWARNRRAQWGEHSPLYQNRVLGEFASDDEEGVIPLAWVEAANERWRAWHDKARGIPKLTAVGCDVGHGGDKSVLALRAEWVIVECRPDTRKDTMHVVGLTKALLDAYGGRAMVDVIGIGAGVVDRLREQKANVFAFHAGEGTHRQDRSGELTFANTRAAAWWNVRDLLNPAYGAELALPPDDELTGDLVAPKWRSQSSGRIVIEEKSEIKARLGRSTDYGDAVVMALWEPEAKRTTPAAGPVGFGRPSPWTGLR